MLAKRLAAALLLAFVAFSLVELVLKELRRVAWAACPPLPSEAVADKLPLAPRNMLDASAGGAAVADGVVPRRTIVYYFHGSRECAESRRIEEFGREAVANGFAARLADGSLAWRVVNYDEPASRHFDVDYKLGSAPAIVLVELDHGRQVRWKYLTDVWSLATTADRSAFMAYVERELQAFLEK